MSDIVIAVDSLSKAYRIGLRERHGRTFREALTDTLVSPVRRLKSLACGANGGGAAEETFWALKDVSFEVKRGEVVGIIGRNGAGKSTLLKILSRITEPTSGKVRLRGRVASLLEVGTGFHPELTGRENIYLNGAIMGMKRAEIAWKFDEIVAFAEVEKFLDTPVKHYSSGMYVRLAFAVAAHLEPEILIVDEVLAVGDAEFQKKCLGKMQEVAQGQGRTVLFVSHNMAAVQALCQRVVFLSLGSLEDDGDAGLVIPRYLSSHSRTEAPSVATQRRYADHLGASVRIVGLTPNYGSEPSFPWRGEITFDIRLTAKEPRETVWFGYTLTDANDVAILSGMSAPVRLPLPGDFSYRLTIADARLAPGTYQFALSVSQGDLHAARRSLDVLRPGVPFEVASTDARGEVCFNWSNSLGTISMPIEMTRLGPHLAGSYEYARGIDD